MKVAASPRIYEAIPEGGISVTSHQSPVTFNRSIAEKEH